MNLDNITTQPFILSLFKRDDGVRFLLGSGAYEFKNSQLHFVANAFMNDVVEVQGNDGALLAGQVRRAKVQPFDGYVGDGSTIKSKVEQYRTNFMKFFQKNHFYTVIYIFPDGTAIQRRRGYIVDAPEVKELYQTAPEYHIAFNFEDVNYYKYSENDEGEETYSNLAEILSSITVAGGLVWDNASSTIETKTKTGTNITLDYSTDDGFDDVEIYGDTEQQTYSGKNLFGANASNITLTSRQAESHTINGDNSFSVSGTGTWIRCTVIITGLEANTQYSMSSDVENTTLKNAGWLCEYNGNNVRDLNNTASFHSNIIFTTDNNGKIELQAFANWSGTSYTVSNTFNNIQLEKGNHQSSFEPYVGGTASPNPLYPQEVQTVTGEQTITITDGDSQTQTLTVDLARNLFDSTVVVGGIGAEGVGLNRQDRFSSASKIKVSPNTTYTFSATPKTPSATLNIVFQAYDASGTVMSPQVPGDYFSTLPLTFTTPAGCEYLTMNGRYADNSPFGTVGDITDAIQNIQLEKGSTATTYFTNIELCKIGGYQDYIYKDNGDWYIHREVGVAPITSSDASWYRQGSAHPNGFTATFANVWAGGTVDLTASVIKMSDYYHYEEVAWTGGNGAFGITSTGVLWLTHTSDLSLADFKTWLNINSPKIYAPLATATDTQITDATLVSQLEALVGADTYTGGTNVVISGNLAGTLSITYTAEIVSGGGVEWDNYGAIWEDGGGGGQTIITVDSITNVLPTIKITGPATNPILTNITTGQAIKYYGNVLASQTLVIDVNEKTAKLNGTSVIQNVDGDWLQLAPGNNRMEYTVDNAEQVSATIEWQEIVG